MRLGKVLTQTIAVLIAVAIIVFGYIWYRQREVTQFRADVLERFQFSDLNAMLAAFASAPDMTCAEDHSDFNSSTRAIFFHAGTYSRFDLTDMTSGKTQHWVMDAENLYVWSEESEYVVAMEAGPSSPRRSVGEAIPPLFVRPICDVWWSPDKSVFRVPVGKPTVQYDELQ